MKLSLIVTLLLSSLSLAQVPANSGPKQEPAAAPTPAKAAAVPSESPPPAALPTQLPPDKDKPPVRTKPFGELLEPEPSKPASRMPAAKSPESQPPGLEKRTNILRDGAPAQLPRGTVSREIDTKSLPDKLPAKVPTVSPPKHLVKPPLQPAATSTQLMAAAMTSDDANNRPAGRSIPLLEALSFAQIPQRQLDVIHAYWHLVSSVARYNLECRLVRRLEDLRGQSAKGTALSSALASATAAREEARCDMLASQHALAEVAMLGVGDQLPLPADLPHVGPYRTRFAEIFAARPATPRLVLIDRALPIHCKSIDARARAVSASDNSLRVAMADRADIDEIIACATQYHRQHVALVESVCKYNHEIAEYAVTSLGQPVSSTAMVSMLIKTSHSSATHFDPRTQPASATGRPGQLPVGARPTLAPPRSGGMNNTEPRTAPPATRVNPIRPSWQLNPRGHNPAGHSPVDREPARLNPQQQSGMHGGLLLDPPSGPTKAPPRLNSPAAPAGRSRNAEPLRPVVPVQPPNKTSQAPSSAGQWAPPTVRSSNKPAVDFQSSGSGLYASLSSASALDRAGQLVHALYAGRNPPSDVARPIELADYLALGQGMNRRSLVEAFWLNRQLAAELQVVLQQSELLDEIRVPGSKRLEAARLAAKADTIDARIRLLESQFGLTNLVGKTVEPVWITASGEPRWTAYEVAPIATGADTWEFRRLRAMIPAMHQTLCRRAAAVVDADAARAASLGHVDDALARTLRQTEETMAFLSSATAYNNAVAGYVLRILPPNVPNRVLAEKLMAGT